MGRAVGFLEHPQEMPMKVGGAVVEPSTASIADIAESDYHVRFVPKTDIN